MATMIDNLFGCLPEAAAAEQAIELLARPGLKIERIVSSGHATPPGSWYEQPLGEWVAVLSGEARLQFEDEPCARTLRAGDFVDIAPRRRHRVEWTDPAARTIWLAVHYEV
jgi:cupin 2 domain-containing protein